MSENTEPEDLFVFETFIRMVEKNVQQNEEIQNTKIELSNVMEANTDPEEIQNTKSGLEYLVKENTILKGQNLKEDIMLQKNEWERRVKSIKRGPDKNNCKECNYTASTKKTLKKHVQAKHENIRYSCADCEYKATTNPSLQIHREAIHENIRYHCAQCDYKATQKQSLKRHVSAKHLI